MTTLSIDPTALQVTLIGTIAMGLRFIYVTAQLGKARILVGGRAPEDTKLSQQYKKTIGEPFTESQSFGIAGDLLITNEENGTEEDEATTQNKKEYQAALANFHRWERIMGNDHENVPFGLIVSFGTLLAPGNPIAHIVGHLIFVVGRFGHTISYALANQPIRSTSFALAIVGIYVMLINAVIGALSMDSGVIIS